MDNSPSPARHLEEKLLVACRHLENTTYSVSLAELSGLVGMSPSHFQRIFSRWVGLSPKRYAMACRDERVRLLLSQGLPVTQAFLAAGYETPSRFYEGIIPKLGMKPSQYRYQGIGAQLRVSLGSCSLGDFLVAISDHGVCSIELGGDAQVLLEKFQTRFAKAIISPASDNDNRILSNVVGLLEGSASAHFPLDIRGTIFQQQVWDALRRIPRGKIASYSQVALAIGKPSAQRAVARACAANPLAVAIPCHRVVRTDGGLSGYRWGIERKQALLDREKARRPVLIRG